MNKETYNSDFKPTKVLWTHSWSLLAYKEKNGVSPVQAWEVLYSLPKSKMKENKEAR